MRFVRQLAPLLLILGSCAPKATLVEEADKPTPPTVNTAKPELPTDFPDIKPNDGLLDPPGLTRMPTQGDMKSTIEDTTTRVIANPPEGEEPTSE